LVKSVTTLKKEELGFLKGDMKDKFDPFMWSYYINMEKVVHEASIKSLLEQEYIRPFPLAYIKGSSLDDCIIIADEMQNIILDNALTLLTRLGSNAKLIVLGDIDQIDLANKKDSSLEPLLEMYADVPQIGTIEMDDNDDNVRNPLIDIIVAKYKEYMAASGNSKTYNGKKQLLLEQISDVKEQTNGE
jgi:phosphate starvation-inducible PhoH-like protein